MAKNSEWKFTVKKSVTMQSLKVLDKHGLIYRGDRNDMTMTLSLNEVCLNENSLREVCEAIFDQPFADDHVNWENIDLREVSAGWKSFLLNFANATRN